VTASTIDAHDSWCAANGVCGARDLRGGGGLLCGIGPNGWCQLPLGHVGAWHSNEPKGRGGFVIVLADSTEFIPRGACPVFR